MKIFGSTSNSQRLKDTKYAHYKILRRRESLLPFHVTIRPLMLCMPRAILRSRRRRCTHPRQSNTRVDLETGGRTDRGRRRGETFRVKLNTSERACDSMRGRGRRVDFGAREGKKEEGERRMHSRQHEWGNLVRFLMPCSLRSAYVLNDILACLCKRHHRRLRSWAGFIYRGGLKYGSQVS